MKPCARDDSRISPATAAISGVEGVTRQRIAERKHLETNRTNKRLAVHPAPKLVTFCRALIRTSSVVKIRRYITDMSMCFNTACLIQDVSSLRYF